MAEKHSPEIVVDLAVDDLKQVRGIGPAVEERLNKAGVVRYTQLAALKPKKLASLLRGLAGFTEQRIIDQDWIGQARKLAAASGGAVAAGEPQARGALTTLGETQSAQRAFPKGENSHNRQHYAVFTVELLLDKDQRVRRTRAMHVQTQQEIVWAGWDEARLEQFMIQSAGLQFAPTAQEAQPPEAALLAEAQEAPARTLAAKEAPVPAGAHIRGEPVMRDLRLVSSQRGQMVTSLAHDQPAEVQFRLDLSQAEAPPGVALRYEVSLFARDVGEHERRLIGREEGEFLYEKSVELRAHGQPLAPGDYLLETMVALWPSSQPRRLQDQLTAMLEGMRVHVY